MPPGRGSSSATVPSHSTCLPGSVRNGQMVSGVASIMISRTSSAIIPAFLVSFAGFGRLGDVAQSLEAGGPVVVEEGAQLGHRVGVRPVQAASAVTPFGHEVCVLEDRQML